MEDQLRNQNEIFSPLISSDQGKRLLLYARSCIEHFLRFGERMDSAQTDDSNPLQAGIFVTLWANRDSAKGESAHDSPILRGCIGHLQSELPVTKVVQDVAIGAATRDPRFPPLVLSELDTIDIEIAILSPLRIITDLQQISVGRDGLMIEGLGKRGLLLPKVAVRLSWDRESFLFGVCQKAGLPEDCWPGDCVLYAFTTVVFSEAAIDR